VSIILDVYPFLGYRTWPPPRRSILEILSRYLMTNSNLRPNIPKPARFIRLGRSFSQDGRPINRKGRQDGSLELTSVLPNKANLQPFIRSSTQRAPDPSEQPCPLCGKGYDFTLLEDVSPRNLDRLAVNPTVLICKKTGDNAAYILRFTNTAECSLARKHRFEFFVEATT